MSEVEQAKIRFTWNISYHCNYRCSYCFFDGKWEEYEKRTLYRSVDEWVDVWSRIYKRYGPISLIVTGGEPFLYPGFTLIIKELCAFCQQINISTNASIDYQAFLNKVEIPKVSLSLSYQREFQQLDVFLEKVKFIKAKGALGCLNLVAYPPYLNHIKEDRRRAQEVTGDDFKVLAFFGAYGGKQYPESYTQEERELIGATDEWFQRIQRQGVVCNAGHTSALVFPDGKVARCGQIGERQVIGNFFDADFMLAQAPQACDAEYCPCAEYSITGEDDRRTKTSQSVDELLAINHNLAQLNNKINFAWDIHYKCNFRCPYCWFFDNWAQQARRNTYLSVEEWMVCWKRIYDKYGEAKIAITGGEPFLYPNFIELVQELSRLHIVKITTNMSGNIEKFIQEISPRRVYLDLNFHPVFIKNIDEFIRKVKLLHQAGFDAGVCYLAYPPQLGALSFYKQKFEENRIRFALAAFWGKCQGKQYPESYRLEEKEMIKPFLGEVDRVDYHLNSLSPKGRICNAGHRYANIQGDGKVARCAQYAEEPMGNILHQEFSLFDKPIPCDRDKCPGNEYDNIVSCA